MKVSTPYQYFQFAKENTQTKKRALTYLAKVFRSNAHLHSAKVSENKKRANIGVADQ